MENPNYKCTQCQKSNCKLWRENGNPKLFCAVCAGKYYGIDVSEITDEGKVIKNYEPSDQIGRSFPAVPRNSGNGFYQYQFIPTDAMQWWQNLPSSSAEKAMATT